MIQVRDGGFAYAAAGDTLPLEVDSLTCAGGGGDADDCVSTTLDPASFAWRAEPDTAATFVAPGMLHARVAGTVVVSAARAGAVIRDTVTVLRLAYALGWRPRPSFGVVGESLAVRAVVVDSLGGEVAQLPAQAIVGGDGTSGELLDWGGAGPTLVRLDRPGTLTLVTRLAHRLDTLRIPVQARRDSVVLDPWGGVPPISARVRAEVPTLGPGWWIGMFTRTMMRPTCYQLFLYDPDARGFRVRRIVPATAIRRWQLSTRFAETNTSVPEVPGERWMDASLDSIRASKSRCPG
jgi:hypothetical protein